jgi:transcriptional regulator with XRE-family HTH domain
MTTVSSKRSLHEEVRSARQRAGLTQAELGKRLGVSQRKISRWEDGVGLGPNQVTLIEIALELPRGSLLARAGHVHLDTVLAISEDNRLEEDDRQALLRAYRSAIRDPHDRTSGEAEPDRRDGDGRRRH